MRDFKHTMDVLVRAYLNDTLRHSNCYACAVGNLVAAANGYTYTECTDYPNKGLALKENNGLYSDTSRGGQWYSLLDPFFASREQASGLAEIASTGYSLSEVASIEEAFEKADRGLDADDWMFNGLLAVLEVLADIHGVDFSGAQVYERRLSEIHASK